MDSRRGGVQNLEGNRAYFQWGIISVPRRSKELFFRSQIVFFVMDTFGFCK
jgi:hypothetical protein